MSQGFSREKIERALETRITEAPSVLADPVQGSLNDLTVRKYPCRATPIALLADSKRAECGGLQYQIRISEDSSWAKCYTALLNIRVALRRGSGDPDEAIEGTGAYIAAYAVNALGVEDIITWLDIGGRNVFMEDPSFEWYARWVQQALEHKRASKLFKYKQALWS